MKFRIPPRQLNYEGNPRHVGVELEFAAIAVRDSAKEVQKLFGGTIAEEDPHRFHVTGTELGDFTCELDTWLAHRRTASQSPKGPLGAAWEDFQTHFHSVLGDISSLVMPCEIVCPPVPIAELPQLDRLVDALKLAGVQGTRDSPFYAFGAQLNPEIAEASAEGITSVFKAYLLTSDWLRAVMSIDLTRRIVAFADPFPRDYVAKVVNPDYWPELNRLIDDYLYSNPTRNRELDMLPLFTWLDEGRVQKTITDIRVKSRPTFHYRLPDANLGQPGWSVSLEWNRWSIVERLAEQRETLDAMGRAYRENRERFLPQDWALKSSEWLALL